MKFAIPEEVLAVANVLEENGYEAYIVGGCVRDLVLGLMPKDWDITTPAHPEAIQALFPETFYENAYGTVGVVTGSGDPRTTVIEVTPYREEGEYLNARHPSEVRFGVSLEKDLERRDFTMNTLAYRPKTDTLVDTHGGQADIAARLIRSVGDPNARFREDALRMMRAVRFMAQLSFVIEQGTAEAIFQNADTLSHISRERIRDELIKIIETDEPMTAVHTLQKLGLLKHIAPDLERGIGVAQNQAHSFDVYEHLLRTMQHAADRDWSTAVRVAGLFHDISKPETRRWSDEKRDWTFHGHEVVGARVTRRILEDLRFPKDMADKVVALVRWHMFFSDPDQVTMSAVRRMIANVGREHISDLLNLRICDRIGTGRPKEQPFRLRRYMAMVEQALRDPVTLGMLAMDGAGVMQITGERPGPRIGHMLHALLEEVLEDPTKNTREKLEARVLELRRHTDAELASLGRSGKERLEREEAEAVRSIEKRWGVQDKGH
ncbi:HD domain-containing protein [Patescibacteria group bacterium]|nr:HD domain-containing protein [Patescibacteria group bacterium]